MHPTPQIAGRALADPAAIDVEDELAAALQQNRAEIDGAEDEDEPEIAVLDEIVRAVRCPVLVLIPSNSGKNRSSSLPT